MFRRGLIHKDLGERGQVLIIFALGSVALLGMLALAVDVGTLYAERRHAQSVADTAALVGAQHWSGSPPDMHIVSSAGVAAAREYAIKNGYTTNVSAGSGVWSDEVMAASPPTSGRYAGNDRYIEVSVKKRMNPLFSGVLGASYLEVTARAVARCYDEGIEVAILGLKKDDESIRNMGSANTHVDGGTFSRGSTKAQGSKSLTVHGTAYARQGFVGSNVVADQYVGAPYSPPPPDMFDPNWSAPGPINEAGCLTGWDSGGPVEKATMDENGWLHIQPCTYQYIKVRPGDKVIFEPGVYKVTGNKGVDIKGDAHGNGVAFVLPSGSPFETNSQSQVYFGSSEDYNNILIWSQDSGNKAVKINGGANVTFEGTIYAPNGGVELNGNSGGLVRGQVVASNVELGGTSDTAVIYDRTHAPTTMLPTLVE